jgi:hypothetical protein
MLLAVYFLANDVYNILEYYKFLINFFHLAGAGGWSWFAVVFDETWDFFFNLVVVDGETELDHAVDTTSEVSWLVQRETGSEHSGIEQEHDKVLNSLVRFILISLLAEFDNNWVGWVNFHGLLGEHVGGHRSITESLSLHDSFHVSGPAVFTSDENAW